MAVNETPQQPILVPPAVIALRDKESTERAQLSRSLSLDMHAEREDLKAAAEQSLNVILDLNLDGTIRWVSPSWKDVIGTSAEDVKGKSIADLLLENQDAFASAVELMRSDDTKSRIVCFRLAMGPHSVFKKGLAKICGSREAEEPRHDAEEEEHVINLKGQGIMVYDRSSGGECHVCKNPKAFSGA